jgi:hypothetical protein
MSATLTACADVDIDRAAIVSAIAACSHAHRTRLLPILRFTIVIPC